MIQVFEPYWKWECFQHGMYEAPEADDLDRLAMLSVSLLRDCISFGASSRQMVESWPVSSAVHLTAVGTNRRSWVGQASCCFAHGVPEIATRCAWKAMTERERDLANDVADEVIREYERERSEVHRRMATARLFGRDS
jgi:hypothetical protein